MMDAALGFQRVHDEFEPRIPRYLARLAGRVEADGLTQEVFVSKVAGTDQPMMARPRPRGVHRHPTWSMRS